MVRHSRFNYLKYCIVFLDFKKALDLLFEIICKLNPLKYYGDLVKQHIEI